MKRLAMALAFAAFTAQPAVAQEGPRIAHQPSARLPFSAAIQVVSGLVGGAAIEISFVAVKND